MVDDHLINSMRNYFNAAYKELKKEWKSNGYEHLSDCPSFRTAATYREALNVLVKGPEQFDETQLKRMINEDLELEKYSDSRK